MTDRIAELRSLLDKATAGPWEASDREVRESHGGGAIASTYPIHTTPEAADVDADLIAAMRNALPLLLDVVEAARGNLNTVRDLPVNAHTIDIIYRQDARETRYEGDWIKHVVRALRALEES